MEGVEGDSDRRNEQRRLEADAGVNRVVDGGRVDDGQRRNRQVEPSRPGEAAFRDEIDDISSKERREKDVLQQGRAEDCELEVGAAGGYVVGEPDKQQRGGGRRQVAAD